MQNDVLYNRIMKKIDELEPGGGGGGYDFVITGEWEEEWLNLTLESGTYSAILTAIQSGDILKGVFVANNEDRIIIYTLATYTAGDPDIYITFMGVDPDSGDIRAFYFIIGPDGTVIAD